MYLYLYLYNIIEKYQLMPSPLSFKMKYFVMNLTKDVKRRENFNQMNSLQLGDHYEFYPAVYGKDLNLEELVDLQIFDETILHPAVINKSIVGNIMTQRSLWYKCIELDHPIVVMEDDAVVSKNILKCVDELVGHLTHTNQDNQNAFDFDFILLGYNFDSNIQFEFLSNEIQSIRGEFTNKLMTSEHLNRFKSSEISKPVLFRLIEGFGVPGYIISPKGARQLLELCFPFSEKIFKSLSLNREVYTYTLDILMNRYHSKLKSFICFPPLVVAENDKLNSSCTPHEHDNIYKTGF